MSVNMSGDDPIDYASFEYQQIGAQVRTSEDEDGEANASAVIRADPLGELGGLDNNEVAELVYLETYAGLEYEQETGVQNLQTFTEFRGTVGANLDANPADGVSENVPGAPANLEVEIDRENTTRPDFSERTALGRSSSRDEVFQAFRVTGTPQISDSAASAGSGGYDSPFHAEKNWRALTNRGPVLDSNDDLCIYGRLVNADSSIRVAGNVRLHMVWDVSETDDAGRQFSVPS